MYSLHVVPHLKHSAALKTYDNAVMDCVESLLSGSFSDSKWLLASLSTKMGGLGLRSTEKHSPAAFLSSQIACRELCKEVDPHYRTDQEHTHNDFTLALSDYNTKVKPDQQIEENVDMCPHQQTLSHAIDCNTLETIREASTNNVHYQAHINHTTASGAGS